MVATLRRAFALAAVVAAAVLPSSSAALKLSATGQEVSPGSLKRFRGSESAPDANVAAVSETLLGDLKRAFSESFRQETMKLRQLHRAIRTLQITVLLKDYGEAQNDREAEVAMEERRAKILSRAEEETGCTKRPEKEGTWQTTWDILMSEGGMQHLREEHAKKRAARAQRSDDLEKQESAYKLAYAKTFAMDTEALRRESGKVETHLEGAAEGATDESSVALRKFFDDRVKVLRGLAFMQVRVQVREKAGISRYEGSGDTRVRRWKPEMHREKASWFADSGF